MRHVVSVCIPVYNGADHILDSVRSVLSQHDAEYEVLIIDNASTDGTYELVRGLTDRRVRVIRNDKNIGMVPNWNRALELAAGTYIKVMAHDDLLLPGCLARQVEALRSAPHAVLAASRRSIIDGGGRVLKNGWGLGRLSGVVDGEEVAKAVVRSGRNLLGEGMGVLFRADRSREVGGFDGRWPYVADLEYWMRLLRGRSMVAIPEVLAAFRVATDSVSARSVATDQSQQLRALLDAVRVEFPHTVSRLDVLVGGARARGYARLRRLVYARRHSRRKT